MTFTVNASLLDAIVLSVVSTEDTYGYKITQEVNKIIGVSESTLYPVLRRLQKDSNLEVYDMEYLGRNRRYYKITGRGKVLLNLYQEEWKIYKEKIDRVFNKNFSPLEPESFSEFEELEEIETAGKHYGSNDASGKARAANSQNSKNSQENKKNPEKLTAEEKIARLKIGEKIDNLKIPEKISNLKIGEKIDNLKISEKIENLKIGEKFDSLKIPEKISSLKLGEKIEDIGGKVDHFLNKESKAGLKDKVKEKSKTKNEDTDENIKNNESEE